MYILYIHTMQAFKKSVKGNALDWWVFTEGNRIQTQLHFYCTYFLTSFFLRLLIKYTMFLVDAEWKLSLWLSPSSQLFSDRASRRQFLPAHPYQLVLRHASGTAKATYRGKRWSRPCTGKRSLRKQSFYPLPRRWRMEKTLRTNKPEWRKKPSDPRSHCLPCPNHWGGLPLEPGISYSTAHGRFVSIIHFFLHLDLGLEKKSTR
jgi:hypothetical protein